MADSAGDGHLSIGEVLGVLVEEFPDVTISKIRFLESQGLIAPERTPSGYRKFYGDDVDLLRVILTEQRENYLPLRVIKDRLDSGEIDPTGEHLRPAGVDVLDDDDDDADEDGSNGNGDGRNTAVQVDSTNSTTAPTPAPTAASTDQHDHQHDTANDATTATATAATGDDTRGHAASSPASAPAASSAGSSASAPASTSGSDDTSSSVRPDTKATALQTDERPAHTQDEGKVRALVDAKAQADRPAGTSSDGSATAPNRSRDTKAADESSDAADPAVVPGSSVASHPAARSAARRDDAESASPRLLPGVMLDANELCGMVGITKAELEELESFGIVVGREVIGGRVYTEDAVAIAKPAAALLRAGVDSRHLRAWRTAAEREASLYEQLITPRLRQRNPEARADAMAQLRQLEATGDALHDAMVRSALRPHFES